jgi:hypothetical protein
VRLPNSNLFPDGEHDYRIEAVLIKGGLFYKPCILLFDMILFLAQNRQNYTVRIPVSDDLTAMC